MKARLIKENLNEKGGRDSEGHNYGSKRSHYDKDGFVKTPWEKSGKENPDFDHWNTTKEGYSDDQIAEVGIQYQEFLDYIHKLNYDDLIEYAEKSGHFKTLSILDYLKKKSKFI